MDMANTGVQGAGQTGFAGLAADDFFGARLPGQGVSRMCRPAPPTCKPTRPGFSVYLTPRKFAFVPQTERGCCQTLREFGVIPENAWGRGAGRKFKAPSSKLPPCFFHVAATWRSREPSGRPFHPGPPKHKVFWRPGVAGHRSRDRNDQRSPSPQASLVGRGTGSDGGRAKCAVIAAAARVVSSESSARVRAGGVLSWMGW